MRPPLSSAAAVFLIVYPSGMVTKTSSGMAVCRAVRIWIMLRFRLSS